MHALTSLGGSGRARSAEARKCNFLGWMMCLSCFGLHRYRGAKPGDESGLRKAQIVETGEARLVVVAGSCRGIVMSCQQLALTRPEDMEEAGARASWARCCEMVARESSAGSWNLEPWRLGASGGGLVDRRPSLHLLALDCSGNVVWLLLAARGLLSSMIAGRARPHPAEPETMQGYLQSGLAAG